MIEINKDRYVYQNITYQTAGSDWRFRIWENGQNMGKMDIQLHNQSSNMFQYIIVTPRVKQLIEYIVHRRWSSQMGANLNFASLFISFCVYNLTGTRLNSAVQELLVLLIASNFPI